jgi:serine/threonine protein kinase
VFKAFDRQTGQYVALKVTLARAGANAERFAQEARLLAELVHPAIVRFIAHGDGPSGEQFIAMEWLEGETLEARLGRGPLSVIDTVALGRRILGGLALAHSRGVVHRDIKPSNLFLPGNDLANVKLLDFGIARRRLDPRRLTAVGSTLGTPMYMSPEQARGQGDIDSRADLFSLGCVLVECLTGQPPFGGKKANAAEVLAEICLGRPFDVRARCPGLPPLLEMALSRMLAKDRTQRPSDTGVVAAQFAAVERGVSRWQ